MNKMIMHKGARESIIMNSLVVVRGGFRRAEISRMREETRVAKSTSYERVQSTEDCLRAFLEGRHTTWVRWFQSAIDARYEATGGGLEIIADVLREWFEDSQLRGSAVIKVIVSNRDFIGRNLEVGRKPKDELRRFVEQLAVKMGLQYPDIAASAAVLIVERTIATTLMTADLSELKTAQLLFNCLQHALSVGFN